jgi:hypothetical protein
MVLENFGIICSTDFEADPLKMFADTPANRNYNHYQAIAAACCKAWNDPIALPDTIKSIASRQWIKCVGS